MRRSILVIGTALSFLSIATQAGATEFTGKVVRVTDGDTLRIQSTEHGTLTIRLNGLDAPETGRTGGNAATRFMRGLVSGQQLRCEAVDQDRYGRIVAICYIDGRDIAALAVAAGVALDCRRYSGGRYAKFEQPGVAKKIGRRPYC
ncbi:thermonuclease family protein [Roseibium sp.]|uniref:thermonuclease family protein n=1 Tax=Roseibium sp. TaxID=1936156 RepID=UPI003BAC8C09